MNLIPGILTHPEYFMGAVSRNFYWRVSSATISCREDPAGNMCIRSYERGLSMTQDYGGSLSVGHRIRAFSECPRCKTTAKSLLGEL